MKISLLVAASLLAPSVAASNERASSDRCRPMEIMLGSYKSDHGNLEDAPKTIVIPEAQSDRSGPAVLVPSCKTEDGKQRKKSDHPLV